MKIVVLLIGVSIMVSVCTVENHAKVLLTEEKALEYVFQEVDELRIENHVLTVEQQKSLKKWLSINELSKHIDNVKFYVGIASSRISGYAYIGSVKGRHGPIEYIVGIALDGRVQDLAILSSKEKYGRRIKRKSFLCQFIDCYFVDFLKTKKRIDGITGATISSDAVIDGVKKALILFNEIYNKPEKP